MQVLGQSHKLGLLGAIPSPASKQISVWWNGIMYGLGPYGEGSIPSTETKS